MFETITAQFTYINYTHTNKKTFVPKHVKLFFLQFNKIIFYFENSIKIPHLHCDNASSAAYKRLLLTVT